MKTLSLSLIAALAFCSYGCDEIREQQPQAASGVHKTTAKIETGADGLTAEQRNVKERLTEDNKPGSIKHLYVISAYSGQVLIYSTVKGKVTSSGKRLTPTTVAVTSGEYNATDGFPTGINGTVTGEVLQDDGTYGSSVEYLYWWDTKGIYHQHYVSGGQILHIANQPLSVKRVVLNLETNTHELDEPEPTKKHGKP